MKKLCLPILLISITYAQLIINLMNQCLCSDLTIQSDCASTSPDCVWDIEGSSCSAASCSNIRDQTYCAWNLKCMWKDFGCVDFTLCNQLTGYTQRECLGKSMKCPSFYGGNCASFDSLKSCSSYSNSFTCDFTLGSEGLCYWINESCKELTSCSQLDLQHCGNNANICTYDYTTQNCIPQNCTSFKSADYCQPIQISFSKLEFQFCEWNSTNRTCNSANDTSNLDKDSCFSQTLQTYRWVNSTNDCVVCAGKIIYVVIMAIFMIMI